MCCRSRPEEKPTKAAGGGAIRVWVAEGKITALRYVGPSSLDELSVVEVETQQLLARIADSLFRVGVCHTRPTPKPSKARVTAEGDLLIVACQMSCVLKGASTAISHRIRTEVPTTYEVTVR
jgi:hypothetical protein